MKTVIMILIYWYETLLDHVFKTGDAVYDKGYQMNVSLQICIVLFYFYVSYIHL